MLFDTSRTYEIPKPIGMDDRSLPELLNDGARWASALGKTMLRGKAEARIQEAEVETWAEQLAEIPTAQDLIDRLYAQPTAPPEHPRY